MCRSSGQGRGAKSKMSNSAFKGAIDNPDKDGSDKDLLCKLYTLGALTRNHI